MPRPGPPFAPYGMLFARTTIFGRQYRLVSLRFDAHQQPARKVGIQALAGDVNGWVDASGQFPQLDLPDVPTSSADFDPLVAYAGTDVGVFRTTDGGVTWTAYQDSLPRSPVTELRFNRRFNGLFAATMGRGVYVRDL